MAGGEYVELIKLVGGAVGIIVVGIAGVFAGKKQAVEPKGEAVEVLAASFLDSRAIGDLVRNIAEATRAIDKLREQSHDDSRLLRLAIEETCGRLARNTEALEAGSVTPREMATLIGQLAQIK